MTPRAMLVLAPLLVSCGAAAPRLAAAPAIDCTPTEYVLRAELPEHANPSDERRTVRGTNGAFTDECTPEGDLRQFACEEALEPRPGPGHHPHGPRRVRLTGAVVEGRVECEGHCREGACVSRSAGDELDDGPAAPPPPATPPPQIHAQWRRGAPGSFLLARQVVDPSAGRLYVSEPVPASGPAVPEEAILGISAIDVASGAVLWTSTSPLTPLGVESGALVTADEAARELVLLASGTGRRAGACSAPLHTGPETGASLWRDAGVTYLVVSSTWRYRGGIAPPPGMPLVRTDQHTYRLAIGAAGCTLAPDEIAPSPVTPELEVRRRVSGSEATLSLARPGARDEIVLGRGPVGIADAGPTADSRHVAFATPGATPGTTRVVVFDPETGAQLGEVITESGDRGWAIVGSVFVVASPFAIRGVELANGREIWRHRLRERIASVPPAIP